MVEFTQKPYYDVKDLVRIVDLLKNKEKTRDTAAEDLQSVPDCLPALMRAAKL